MFHLLFYFKEFTFRLNLNDNINIYIIMLFYLYENEFSTEKYCDVLYIIAYHIFS